MDIVYILHNVQFSLHFIWKVIFLHCVYTNATFISGQKKGTCALNEGHLYTTDGITYRIPDERLWKCSKIVSQFGGEKSSLVAAASRVLSAT